MRSPLPIGLAVVAASVAANAARDGYLTLVGPKPVVFSRPSVPLAVAIARLPALAKETPDPRSIYGSGTNEPVLLPPPGSTTNGVAKPTKAAADPNDSHGSAETGGPGNGAEGGQPSTAPGSGDPTGAPNADEPPGSGRLPNFDLSGHPPGIPGRNGVGDDGNGLFSPQMLVPFFREPATTNRAGLLFLPIPFTPGRPPTFPSPGTPRPAASSTATYEQH